MIHLCVSFPLSMRAEKTDSPGESQLQLASISSQPVGYGPQTVDVLHMVFSPSLAVHPPPPLCLLILNWSGLIWVFYCFLWREWESGHNIDVCVCVCLYPCIWLGRTSKKGLRRCKSISKGYPLYLKSKAGKAAYGMQKVLILISDACWLGCVIFVPPRKKSETVLLQKCWTHLLLTVWICSDI